MSAHAFRLPRSRELRLQRAREKPLFSHHAAPAIAPAEARPDWGFISFWVGYLAIVSFGVWVWLGN